MEELVKWLFENWEISLAIILTISISIIIKVTFTRKKKMNRNNIVDRKNIRVNSPTIGGDYIVQESKENKQK